MEEIVEEFCQEAKSISEEINKTLEEIESEEMKASSFSDVSQWIEGMLGAAKLMNEDELVELCKMGSKVSSLASYSVHERMNPIICGVLFDWLDIFNEQIENLEKDGDRKYEMKGFLSRMEWLIDKMVIDEAQMLKDQSKNEKEKEVKISSTVKKMMS